MPGYAPPSGTYKVPALSPVEINDLVAFLKAKAGRPANADSAGRGYLLFEQKGQCFDCHGGDALGDPGIGAPNLIDNVWLYGGSDAQITESIAKGRHGIMPAFVNQMPAARLRDVALYVHSLSQAAAKEPR
jgi:cbb3-type cytochrome c oxidase subunit III